MTETFSGDIEGDGVVAPLHAVHKDDSASFVGIERVTGKIAGRQGSFLLQDAGTLQGSTVKGAWCVVSGSGTGGAERPAPRRRIYNGPWRGGQDHARLLVRESGELESNLSIFCATATRTGKATAITTGAALSSTT